MGPLGGAQFVAFGDAVELVEATAAAGPRSMLRDEDGVIPPWRLPSIVARLGRRDPLAQESLSLREDGVQPFPLEIGEFSPLEREAAAELRPPELFEHVVDRPHGTE
jgi:hypothetical protein